MGIPNSLEIQKLLRRVGLGIKTFQDSHLLPYGLTNQQGRLLGFLLEREEAGVFLKAHRKKIFQEFNPFEQS